ncbi:prolyl oligopeptidase family serine peptidase [Staphylococcus sp. GRT3]|uniref:Prolyl oligopeptidase family serine peptidase n=2 Tax=Staphylococcus americanisciuri TaxID=2973940 RepID=A0ABT2F1M9_9STAP|nr:prolyl oligopeptidase family serine peptidase [Staphylococcus americanisciuri]
MVSNDEINVFQINNKKNYTVEISSGCLFIDTLLIEEDLYIIEYNTHKKVYYINDLYKKIFEYDSLSNSINVNTYISCEAINSIITTIKHNTKKKDTDSFVLVENYGSYTKLCIKKNNRILHVFNFKNMKIHKAVAFDDNYIYVHLSTPYHQPSLHFFNISDFEKNINALLNSNKYYTVQHVTDEETQLKYLEYSPNNPGENIAVFLHGGPYFHFDFSYCLLSNKLLKQNFRVFKLNTYGSTGYQHHYKERIYKQAGIVDYNQIISFLKYLNNIYPGSSIFLIGNSYGAYLCSLIGFYKDINLKKILCISPFTDIKYQLLFSNSIKLMRELFSNKYIDNVNPQFLIKNNKLQHSLTIIHGFKDQNCPLQQIYNFKNNLKLIKGAKFKLITYFNYEHYPKNISMLFDLNNKILEEILNE